jgi:hypothetical protein
MRNIILTSLVLTAAAACGETLDPGAIPTDGGAFVPDGSTTSADGATASDGASAQDASVQVFPDGAVAADGGSSQDAGPGGNTSSLTCGSAQCAIPAQVCCVTEQRQPRDAGGGLVYSYACVMGNSCPMPMNGGTNALQCSSAANCAAGTVCCVSQNGQTTTSSCKATCGNNDAQLCDPTAAMTGCSASAPCSNNNVGDWGLPPSYATCGGMGN